MPEDSAPAAIEEAHNLLSDVRAGRQVGLSKNTMVNRLYYTCFHAARAALLSRGIKPKSHDGIENQLYEEFVPDEVTHRDAGIYSEMRDHRERADYTYYPVIEDLDHLLERTEAFVETMEALIEDTDGDETT